MQLKCSRGHRNLKSKKVMNKHSFIRFDRLIIINVIKIFRK